MAPEILIGFVITGVLLLVAWLFVIIGLWRSQRAAFVWLIVLNLPHLVLGVWLQQWIALIPTGLQVLYALARLWGWIGPRL